MFKPWIAPCHLFTIRRLLTWSPVFKKTSFYFVGKIRVDNLQCPANVKVVINQILFIHRETSREDLIKIFFWNWVSKKEINKKMHYPKSIASKTSATNKNFLNLHETAGSDNFEIIDQVLSESNQLSILIKWSFDILYLKHYPTRVFPNLLKLSVIQ